MKKFCMLIYVKVFAKSKCNRVQEVSCDKNEIHFIVRVTAAPEKGQANKAVIELLAKHLNVTKSSIELIKGETCRNKIFRVNNEIKKHE